MCEFQTASEVLSAFRRNKNNGEIDQEETIFYSEILYAFVVFFFCYSDPFLCSSCSLAWIIRDNRHYLPRISGDCINENGQSINFYFVDPDTLKNC